VGINILEKKSLFFSNNGSSTILRYLSTYLPTYQITESHLYNYNLNHSTGFEGIYNHRKLHQNNQSKVDFEPGIYHGLLAMLSENF